MTNPKKSLRYGVIGAGMMGCEHIRNLLALPDTEVVTIADPHAASQKNAKQLVPNVVIHDDYREMLKSDNLDVVVIATPNFHHRAVLEDVLQTGMHVLVEKPLCITVNECQQIIEIEQQTSKVGRVVWVGLEYRYMAPTARLLSEIRSGVSGVVQMIAIREHRFPFLQKVDDWNRFSAKTGGTLVEKCCHFFDLMSLIAQSNAVAVFATGAQDVNHLDEIYDGKKSDILDNAFVIVEFENGIRGMLDLSMFAEGSKNEQEISVVGSLGKIEALVTDSVIRVGKRSGGAIGVEEHKVQQDNGVVAGFHAGASYIEHQAMQRAIRNGALAEVSLQDGLKSVAIGQAAHLSIAEKRRVQLAELLRQNM